MSSFLHDPIAPLLVLMLGLAAFILLIWLGAERKRRAMFAAWEAAAKARAA